MAKTESTMLALGTPAPPFTLTDVVGGASFDLESFADREALLVMFVCRHCPFVKHVEREIARLGRDYANRDVALVGICSNDVVSHPADAPASLAEWARGLELTFPILHDDTQEVAKAYTAACTPDFFLFDRARRLVYRGQLDDSRPSNERPNDGRDLRAALDAVLAGRPVAVEQRPSIGCNIKWRPGNEPSYFG